MSHDVNRERLDRLREDLAALRARTTAEFGLPVATQPEVTPDAGADGSPTDTEAAAAGPSDPVPARDPQATEGPVMFVDPSTRPRRRPEPSTEGGPRRRQVAPAGEDGPPRRRQKAKPPRPPRRFSRPRVRRPARHKVVPLPIEVRRRPSYVAAPRWPQWTLLSATVVLAVLLPAVWQLSYRLLQAMLDTSVLLAADPSRSDFLHAAAGVAGGGLTLALAIAAIAIVKGKAGYLAAAGGVLAVFCVFAYLAYTANAGIVAAPLPPVEAMIRPPRWALHGQLTAVFWLSALALVLAVIDLCYRSIEAVARTVRTTASRRRAPVQRSANQAAPPAVPPTRKATLGTSRTGTDQHH